jgi:predicted aspartyl protease
MVTLGALACTFIETRVENESVLLLVDTGASLTIISKEIFDKLLRKNYLDPIQKPLTGASQMKN